MPEKKRQKICCVFNYASFYREPIYNEMDKALECDFFFGDTAFENIKQLDTQKLKGFKGYIKAKKTPLKGHIWHSGIKHIFNKGYTHYILTGNPKYIINWLIMLYAALTGKKTYLWTHGLSKQHTGFFDRLYHKMFYASATGCLMYNRHNCRFMEDIGCKKEQLHIIHNSLDSDKQTEIYNRLTPENIYQEHFGNSHPTIIYIGRIQKVKKTHHILQALAKLRAQGRIINLVLVGANVDSVEIDKEIKSLELQEQVWLYGPCYNEEENSRLIYNAVACVSPGNVGLTAIHSLTYGTPVITNDNFATQMPEFEAITNGTTGSFFKEDDIDDLANKIYFWTSADSSQREECRKAARKTIENEWNTHYQMRLFKELFNK